MTAFEEIDNLTSVTTANQEHTEDPRDVQEALGGIQFPYYFPLAKAFNGLVRARNLIVDEEIDSSLFESQ